MIHRDNRHSLFYAGIIQNMRKGTIPWTAGSLLSLPAASVPSTFLQALRNLMHGAKFWSVPGLRAMSHSSINSTATWMRHVLGPQCHMTNFRSSINCSHRGLVLGPTHEYQYLWFQFYRASNFYCMAGSAESSSPTGPPSAADWRCSIGDDRHRRCYCCATDQAG